MMYLESPEDVELIKSLLNEGLSIRKLYKKTGHCKNIITKIINKYPDLRKILDDRKRELTQSEILENSIKWIEGNLPSDKATIYRNKYGEVLFPRKVKKREPIEVIYQKYLKLKAQGKLDREIAKALGYSTAKVLSVALVQARRGIHGMDRPTRRES